MNTSKGLINNTISNILCRKIYKEITTHAAGHNTSVYGTTRLLLLSTVVALSIIIFLLPIAFSQLITPTDNPTVIFIRTTVWQTAMEPLTSYLHVSTDKQTYKLGESVTINVRNNGNRSLTFSDAALGLKIKNASGEIYGFLAAQVITELNPGDLKTFEWNQENNDGKQVRPGDYIVTVSDISGSFSANSTFKIEAT